MGAAMPRELLARVAATVIFAGVFGWSFAVGNHGLAAITGFFALANVVFLVVGLYAWRRGLLK
jgi:hypothetical protein